MEIDGKNISENSSKQELLDYLEDAYQPVRCLNQKHKFPYSEICLNSQDQLSNKDHCIYQLICVDCKRLNSCACTQNNHKTAVFIDTLKQLIEQSSTSSSTKQDKKKVTQQEQVKVDQIAQQLILSMKSAIAEMKNAKAALDEQITKLENQKIQLEKDLLSQKNSANDSLREFKELLVQILKQNHSLYCQQYVTQLSKFTEVDNNGQLQLNLNKQAQIGVDGLTYQFGQIQEFGAKVTTWAQTTPIIPGISDDKQLIKQSQVLSVFSYLLNEHKIEQISKLRLIETDKFNQKHLAMPQILKGDYHKRNVKTGTITQCISLMKSLCQTADLQKEYLALIKFLLGFCQLYEIGMEKNEAEGFRMLLESDASLKEKGGYAVAQDRIAYCFNQGKGVAKDLKLGYKFWKMGAEKGYSYSLNGLGCCYEAGEGVEKDLAQAIKYYRMAAEQGNAVAQSNLGFCYKNGEGVAKDFKLAFKYFQMAAENGSPEGFNKLGFCYYDGEGVEKDYDQVIKNYRMAAELGNVEAYACIGMCYYDGIGVEKDMAQAVKYFRKAAEKGNVNAQYNLGVCYENGKGVVQDLELAKKYYQLAADQGDQAAQNALSKFC